MELERDSSLRESTPSESERSMPNSADVREKVRLLLEFAAFKTSISVAWHSVRSLNLYLFCHRIAVQSETSHLLVHSCRDWCRS